VKQTSWLHTAPAALYVAAVFYFGTVPTEPLPAIGSDKVLHFVAFFILEPLFSWAFSHRLPTVSLARLRGLSVSATILVGALLEAWQSVLPHRSSELLDLAADALGALLAAGIGALLAKRRGRERSY